MVSPADTPRKTELTRLLLQALSDMGYSHSSNALSQESGISLESPFVLDFKQYILNANWNSAEDLLQSLGITSNEDLSSCKFMIRQQKYLELLESGNTKSALHVLRHELTPLKINSPLLHQLSAMIMFNNTKQIQLQIGWDGSQGSSRSTLLSNIQKFIPPSTMIPERRLENLIQQAINFQKRNCIYHNAVDTDVSLYTDHTCSKSTFPNSTIHTFDDHADEVWFLAFSHDGNYLASASKDSTSIIWSVQDWKPKHVLTGHKQAISFLAWSPDDTVLLTASNDHCLKSWSVDTGVELVTFSKHTEAVTSCAWLPNGQGFVSGSLEKVIYLWNLQGEVLHKWSGIRVMDLAIIDNGKTLVATSEKKIRIYDMETKNESMSLSETESITSINMSQDGRHILVNLSIQEIHLWDLKEKRLIRKFVGQKQGRFVIRSCFGGISENFVLSGSEDSQVYVWNREQGALIEVLEGHTGCVNSISWNPKFNLFASASDDHTIRIWSCK